MDSFKETQRQIRTAVLGILLVTSIGFFGFMFIEGRPPLRALWLTVITLTTVGYGDDYATSAAGQIFTIFLILTGFGVVAYGLQATATFLVSPQIRELRQRRKTEKIISQLERHYIICGHGELVDQTITYLLHSVEKRLAFYDDEIYNPIDKFLDRIFGDDAEGHYPKTRARVRQLYLALTRPFTRIGTLLDVVVIVTEDKQYARYLREDGFLVIEGNATSDEILLKAGIERANAIMVMLPDDTDTLLSVLTARSHNNRLYITGATLGEVIAGKILRIGANNAIRPYELAAQFLNSVTLRPTVYDFFHGILFDQSLNIQTTQVRLNAGSVWIHKRISELQLEERFDGHLLAIQPSSDTEHFVIAPPSNYRLSEGEILVIAAPNRSIADIQSKANEGATHTEIILHQKPQRLRDAVHGDRTYTQAEAETVIQNMSKHFIICGDDEIAKNAIHQLDPTRPFVIISNNEKDTQGLLIRGFCVIHGDPTQDETLLKAGADRALAMMISLEDEADTVLTVINARSLSKRLLITATAISDEHIRKILRAGADRVINPFSIAAQFVLLSTTRPTVSSFFQYVLYNKHDEIETTELYMQDNSPWIGKTIADLRLTRLFRAYVLGVRHANGIFSYAPTEAYEIQEHEVLIIVTPMANADELRTTAHGSATKRPDTLRNIGAIPTTIRRDSLLD